MPSNIEISRVSHEHFCEMTDKFLHADNRIIELIKFRRVTTLYNVNLAKGSRDKLKDNLHGLPIDPLLVVGIEAL